MSHLNDAYDTVCSMDYRHSDLAQRTSKLTAFAKAYVQLSNDEVNLLRASMDSKDKFDHFTQASYLFRHSFPEADINEKEKLLKAFFAFYSLDNMEFGYDTLLILDSVSNLMDGFADIAMTTWLPYVPLTGSHAKNAMENRLLANLKTIRSLES